MLREARPDLVHAHDIFAAKMISEFGVPFVYDNHEYWSEYSKILADANNRNAFRNLESRLAKENFETTFKENSKRLCNKIMEKVGKRTCLCKYYHYRFR